MSRDPYFDDLLGAHALDAVDEHEREAVEAYLDQTPEALAEALRLDAAVSALAATQTADVPEGSWERLRAELRTPTAEGLDSLPVLRLPTRTVQDERPPARRRRIGLAAAVLAMAAALVVGIAIGVARPRHDGGSAADRLSGLAATALADPAARRADLVGNPGLSATVVVTEDGRGYLLGDDLVALPADRTYQLWSLDGAAPVSLAVLGNDPGVVAFPATAGVTSLAVTEEPAPGAAAPGQAPVLSGTLS
jgi:hypothetical protein